MSLIVETGAGSTTANSFVTDAEYVEWVKARYPNFDRGSASDRLPHLINAADYLRREDRLVWRGTKKTAAQTMPYPRTGVVERRGPSIGDTVIPYRVKDAQCFAAYLSQSGTDLHVALVRGGGIKSKTVGPISTTFMDNAPAETVFPFIAGILAPLLYLNNRDEMGRLVPTMSDPVTVRGFETGEFGSPADDRSNTIGS